MKTKNLFFIAAVVAVLLTAYRGNAQAGCPYTITNNLLCPIEVTYEIFDTFCTSLTGPVVVTIPGLNNTIVGSAYCGSMADIFIEVTDINTNGGMIPPNSPQSSPVNGWCGATNFSDGGSCSTSCDQSGNGIWTITWGTTNAIVQ